MKKLMIAAAAAAMVSGAFATQFVYDYSASLKTTKVKTGSQTTKYTVNVGRDDEGIYWWDQAGAPWVKDEDAPAEYISPSVAKKYIQKLSNDEKRELATSEWIGFDEEVGEVERFYNKDSDGKWCFSFTYKVTDTDCYRVAGSTKVTDTVYCDSITCCDIDAWEFDDGTPICYDLFYRFGGITAQKATKIEALAWWGKDSLIERPSRLGNTDYTGEYFIVAGQGIWSDKLVKVDGDYLKGVKNISGNIVGMLENPGCKDCCNYPVDALCFECDETPVEATDTETQQGYTLSEANGTAAYGTWSIKFNSKKSFK